MPSEINKKIEKVKKWLSVSSYEFRADAQDIEAKSGSEEGTCKIWKGGQSENLFTEDIDRHEYRIFVGTWNVAGLRPGDDVCLEKWLDMKEPADIYVVGFQEIVPLNAGNVICVKDDGSSAEWEALIHRTLNPEADDYNKRSLRWQRMKRSRRELRNSSVVPQYGHFERPVQLNGTPECYVLVASKQMVGIFLTVWIRRNLCEAVRSVRVSCVGCGLMGFLGNKGAISFSMLLHQTSFCFICTHLTSGEKQGDELRRNADVAEILRRTYFAARAHHSGGKYSPRRILAHEKVIWFGDLNYRLVLNNNATMELLGKGSLESLLENDQLSMEQKAGRVFASWNEGVINFAPTYKYCLNSDFYTREIFKHGQTCRTPAWCDRILWIGKGLKQIAYGRSELRFSDHRPVRAVFLAAVQVDYSSG
ncbi:hypothetical protein O6H91_Y040900 [Diphasiastrum complanatum]|nr:hypothetical protein O6H91_Y054600 [Diphasiastrum complanatum]KAJ7297704.1 hypothetical protein O6H91_Y040900 [Diphasiastrum complanatum]KAJ7297706.1 hypothetical protein O6H91_Y040900 [Diphasiastrum complanatum]KAJ7297711.1 hypothetical protein O6H91_Y040900 [Diphasiastrum complanatum]